MRILLTGGTGFIGKNLYEGLLDKFKIFTPCHKELDLLDGIAVRKYIKKNKIKVVIHTAVKGGDDVFDTTLKMFMSIYKCLDLLDKFINFGSGAEYNKLKDLRKIKEERLGVDIPKDDYGLSKLICSLISKNNKKIVTLIPFGIFGKYEGYKYKFISNSIIKNIFGLPIKIKQNVVFDYLYIDDLIPIIIKVLSKKGVYGDINVTPNRSISLIEIAKIINKIGRRKSKISVENKGLNYQYSGSNKKLKTIISNIKFTSYNRSILEFYNYYLSISEDIKKADIMQHDYYKACKTKKYEKK